MISRQFGLLSSSALYGLGSAAQRLVGFLLLPLYTHYLTPAAYGVVGLFLVLPTLLLPIFSLGLNASISVSYFSSTKATHRESVIQTSRLVTIVSATIMIIVSLVTLDWITILTANNLDYRWHTLVVIITVALNVLCVPMQLEQQFSARSLEFVIVSLVGAISTALGSVILVVFFQMSALGVLLGNMFGQSMVLLLLLGYCKNNRWERSQIDHRLAIDLVKHGLPMLPSFILLFILQNWVRWPLERAHGVDAVGLFALGSTFGSVLALITSSFAAAWTPWALGLSSQWEDGRHEVALRFAQYFAGVSFVLLLFFCAAQPLLTILTPPDYFFAWQVVGLSAAAHFMISLFSILLPPVYMEKKVFLILISQAIAALVTVIATYLLIDLGIIGAALAVFLGSATLVIAQLAVNSLLTKRQPIPFDRSSIFRVGVMSIFACASTFLLRIEDLPKFILLSLLLIATVGLVTYKYFPDRQLLIVKYFKRIG